MIVPASVTKNEFLNSYAGPKATSLVSALVILSFLSFGTTINETFETPNQLATITGLAYQSLVVSFGYFVVFGWLVNKFFSESNISRVVALIILFFTKILLSPPPPSSLLAHKGQRTLRPSDTKP